MTPKLLHEMFLIDFEQGSMVWRDIPGCHPRLVGKEAGCVSWGGAKHNKAYRWIMIAGKNYKRARLIYLAFHGEWPTPKVDHKNGDSLDDRISNLRQATQQQNCWNRVRTGREHAGSLPLGVSRASGNFRTKISHNGKQMHIGVFRTAEEASAAYQAKRKELFGEFAFPSSSTPQGE